MLNLKEFRSAAVSDTDAHNVFIGISLGKYLDVALASEYLRWALDHGKQVAVLIADDINAINYQQLHGYSEKSALRKVRKLGDAAVAIFEEALNQLSAEIDVREVRVLRWRDIQSQRYASVKVALDEEFNANNDFKQKVLAFVDTYLARRNYVPLDIDKEKLAQYILSELPTLITGIDFEGTHYGVLLYPTYKEAGLSRFVISIQEGVWSNLAGKLDLSMPAVLVEAYIEGPS